MSVLRRILGTVLALFLLYLATEAGYRFYTFQKLRADFPKYSRYGFFHSIHHLIYWTGKPGLCTGPTRECINTFMTRKET
jgi:hypothetical protein